MRLFYALFLNDETLSVLQNAQRHLQDHVDSGSFTRRQNLHLTVQFLGETPRFDSAVAALDAVDFAPFPLTVQRLGRFQRRDGDLLWSAAANEKPLQQLNAALRTQLKRHGFTFDERPFKGHVTLARRVRFKPGVDFEALAALIPPTTTEISRLHLVESHRVNGKLTYTTRHSGKASPY